MKNECSIVSDLMPLYLEKMVSEDTDAFVEAHLAHCPDCAALFQSEYREDHAGYANTSTHKTERELFKKRLAKMMTVLFVRVVQVLTVAYTCFLVLLFSYEAVRLENDSFEVIIGFLYIFISYLPLYLAEWSTFQDVRYFLCLPKTRIRTAFHGFSMVISFVWTVIKFLQLSRLVDGLWIIYLDYGYLLLWILCRYFISRQGKILEKYNKI